MKKLMIIVLLVVGCGTEPEDCAGVEGGTAELDNCNVCDTDLSNDCIQDCSDEWGGSKINDCKGVCGGSAVEDACGICNGGLITCPDTICDNPGHLPDCVGYEHPVNDCHYGGWVGDGFGDCEDQPWGFDFTCYSFDDDGDGDPATRGPLCQLTGVGEQDSGLPACTEGNDDPDGGDCDCNMEEQGWQPECPDFPNCDWCCGTYRDPACHECNGMMAELDGYYCDGADDRDCAGGYPYCDCDKNVEDCAGVCGGSAIVDECGDCGGDGSSCGSGD